ncbi:hypothetical protein SPYSS1447_1547 [Streptococcus pyogenes SS1447]|nr:hypothetical protein SPYSS1447_1547 [Streptococcus pyogenes SS1447]
MPRLFVTPFRGISHLICGEAFYKKSNKIYKIRYTRQSSLH